MKRVWSILCALALLVTFFGAAAPNARAVDWEFTFHGNVDYTENFVIYSNTADKILDKKLYSGEIPGMELTVTDDTTLALSGVPTKAGSYTVSIHMETNLLGDVDIKVTVNIKPALTSGTPKVTKDPTGEEVVEGDPATFIARADNVREYRWQIAIADASMDVKDLPDYLGKNVKVSGWDTEKVVISNIPLELNDAYIWCEFIGTEKSVDSKAAVITVIPEEDATPVVTKDPTDETVDEGGRAVFVAKAKYVQTYQWEFISPQGVTYDCDGAQKALPGLKITGEDTQKIILTEIPAEMDGFRIRCKFTAGEDVYSKWATIHVKTEATEPPTEEPTEAPTEEPTEEVTEEPTEETTQPTGATEETEETEPTVEPPAEKKGSPITTLLIVLILAAAAVAIAAIVAFTVLKIRQSEIE